MTETNIDHQQSWWFNARQLVTIPTLMLNGKFDHWPVKTLQKPIFELLGTPPEHKKHVIYESGHLPLPRAQILKEIFAWLDKYQGVVNWEKTGEQTKQDK